MYRVFLIPSHEYGRKEEWFDADTVRQSESGDLWEFVNRHGRIVGQLEKIQVSGFQIATDRRKPRKLELVPPLDLSLYED
jgi:hypothetical protein